VQIDWLGHHPQHVATLADWHVRAFADWVSGWQLDQARGELASHAVQRGLPTTLIALDGEQLLGSVSLLDSDPPAPDRYAPWLGSLYVRPEARRRGVGAALVAAAVAEAARLGIATLHLWTPDRAALYARLGWCALGLQRFGGVRATVMQRDCRGSSP
jgi:GNAT superfamily N-acetyltransferase